MDEHRTPNAKIHSNAPHSNISTVSWRDEGRCVICGFNLETMKKIVRSASVKRVASAVGEGRWAVQYVREYLKTM